MPALVAVALWGCAEEGEGAGACPGLVGCFAPCAGTAECAPGLYCGAGGRCLAQCAPGDRGLCADDEVCSEDGRCVPFTPDAGPESVCATASVDVAPIVPTVQLVVDRSGSMRSAFRGTDTRRWDALFDALFARADDVGQAPGIVHREQGRVRFGAALYRSAGDVCPDLRWREPALLAAEFLRRDFLDYPLGGTTPTAEAVRAATARLAERAAGERVVMVLATDGEPDRCEAPGVQDDAARGAVVEAVAAAHAAGIDTFVVTLADLDGDHVQGVANAGVGLPATADGPTAPFWSPVEIDGLRAALDEIVGGALGCEVALDGELTRPDRACTEGTVRLDGRRLECGRSEDGFRVVGPRRIELLGRACRDFLSGDGTRLEATFPCVDVLD